MSIVDAFAPKQQSPFSVEKLQEQIQNLQITQDTRNNITNGQQNTKKAVNIEKLDNFCKGMSQEKLDWTLKQPEVSEKLQTMKNAFVDYLFESYIVDFDGHCESQNLPYVRNYVNSFIQHSDNYVSQYDKQSQEIAELKEQIARLSKSGGDSL